ncbi:hypothetical protein PG993_012484 [Apiospora rasikravindrae]|uniref:Septum formation initiator n=1 Tax=Apiospora rasikravindrae TaxID=990691 RepID=A0ABR1S2Q2_9PEZI
MSGAATYHARRYRTLFTPDALNFNASPARGGLHPRIHCGLPKAAARNSRGLLMISLPIILATAAVTYMERNLDQKREGLQADLKPQPSIAQEAARRKALLDAYGDRSSLERLEEVMMVYEMTKDQD